ncbi:hypothetical protein [Marinobacterium sediminicola]|uniref:Uncharacterized protein n=1 Tax=Marinobacterium sediminicola TaxID=518898 RepID=A0ABY1RWA2_9GAMM|nr:hypothetical protein [Marinobacterium sediminicola]ULG70423.1 hypothetical protein LN244_06305 [Marinobacterium sediminicola]SMR69399.1 hypothetical protein SAMN04487964_101239 [Marinobacterium sediminicola]
MSGRKKSKTKNSQLVIRINDEERDQFIALCDELDTSAAREIRHFIRRFMAEHQAETADKT